MSNRDQANRGEKLGLVWRNRKKISQIIKDYLNLPFFPVLGIRIRFRMFLGLPDPDPFVRGTDPDPAPDPSLFP
jgi:hypothetical protein